MKPANLGDRPRGKARSSGAVHISHRQYLRIGLLLLSVLYTQHSGVGSKLSPLASSSQVHETAQPTIPMLDEGKGLIHLDVLAGLHAAPAEDALVGIVPVKGI